MAYMKGDIPCGKCNTKDNPIWWTDNILWNYVVRGKEKFGKEVKGEILCINCFIKFAEKKLHIQSWRLIPEFKWKKK